MGTLLALLGAAAGYIVALGIFRLYFSPLAKFPGPRLAAVTSLYAAYHDIIRGGQYIWTVKEMHEKYGPVVRIRPEVLHVNDPAFIDKLYPLSPKERRDRAPTVLNFFTTHLSVLPTGDHDLHRRRRAAIGPFFSQQKVRNLVPVVNATLDDLLRRMERWSREDKPVDFGWPCRAATKDVIQEYAFGEGEKCLEMEDCNAAFFNTISTERLSHIGVHLPTISFLLTKLPPSVITALNPNILGFIRFLEGLTELIDRIKANKAKGEEGSSIFHEILNSSIPDSEKATPRLVDEAMVIAIAGSDTTAMTLSYLIFKVLSEKDIFSRLRAELESVMPTPNEHPDAAKLDRLPFLNALIEETIRFFPTATHRQERLAPVDDLVYEYPDGRSIVIPAGTSIGMTAPILNRHPSWYSDPDSFKPDRYIENPKMMRQTLTFSKGGRQCLGMNLAYQELQTFTAGIFRKYTPYDPSLKVQNGPTMELFETTEEDMMIWADYVNPGFKPGTKGLRVKIRHD